MRAGYSKKSAKTLGVLGKGGYCIKTVKATNSATVIKFPKGLQRACPKFAFILDNAIRHKSETAMEFADSAKGDMRLIFPPQYEPRLNHIGTQWGGGGAPSASSLAGTLPLRRSWTGAINAIHLMRQDETGRIDAVPHTLARRHIMMRRHDVPCAAAGDASAIPTIRYGSMASLWLGWAMRRSPPPQRRAKFGIMHGKRSDCNGRHYASNA